MGFFLSGVTALGGAVQRVSVPMDTAPPENRKSDFHVDFLRWKSQ
jgi:hypothetical protein